MILIIAAAIALWIVWGNTALQVNTYTINSENLPEGFDGYRIAQISDLHNAQIGEDNEKLASMLEEAAPDIIVITGDFIDSRRTDVEVSLEFAEKAVKIAPCYYVTGNHEGRVSEYEDLRNGLIDLGVTVLEDEVVELINKGDSITLIGVDDPSLHVDPLFDDEADIMEEKLQRLASHDSYTVLLSHRPELFDIYVANGVDLVFTGHAHGGQIRIPFLGGLIAPHQGILPKYDSGVHTAGNTNMVVSRGIGNSLFPFRVNNRPEIVLVELQK